MPPGIAVVKSYWVVVVVPAKFVVPKSVPPQLPEYHSKLPKLLGAGEKLALKVMLPDTLLAHIGLVPIIESVGVGAFLFRNNIVPEVIVAQLGCVTLYLTLSALPSEGVTLGGKQHTPDVVATHDCQPPPWSPPVALLQP